MLGDGPFSQQFVTAQVRCAVLDLALFKNEQICCPKVRRTSEAEQF
jgi:hypothetical protein